MTAQRAYLHPAPGAETIATMLDLAEVGPSSIVGVPCAGSGEIAIAAGRRAAQVYAYDDQSFNFASWRSGSPNIHQVCCHFPSLDPVLQPRLFPACDAVVMNLEVGGAAAERYVAQSAALCRSEGLLVVLMDMADAMRLTAPETVLEAGRCRACLRNTRVMWIHSPAGYHETGLLIARPHHLTSPRPAPVASQDRSVLNLR